MKTLKFRIFHAIAFAILFIVLSANAVAQSSDRTDYEESITTTVDNEELKWLPAPDFFPGCSFTILHGDLEKPNLDIFFKIDPNTEVVNHLHDSPERMILISGDLEVQYEDEDPVILTSGNYAYGPAGKPHKAKCLDNGPCVLFIALVDPFNAKLITPKN